MMSEPIRPAYWSDLSYAPAARALLRAREIAWCAHQAREQAAMTRASARATRDRARAVREYSISQRHGTETST